MPGQVGASFAHCLHVLVAELVQRNPTVHLQRPHRRYDDGGAGLQTGLAALDVEEFLGPQVGSEARLGHDIVGQLERGLGGDYGVTTVGNVGKTVRRG